MIRAFALVLPALAVLAAAAPAEIVRLRDGTLVHGSIVDFDEGRGITLERADTGGVLVLGWEHMDADEVRRIKASRGFTGEEPEPYLVDVVHLLMRNGTTETGVLVEGPRNAYALRRRGSVDTFPRSEVRSVETGRAEGLSVHPPDELYRVMLDDLGTPTDAASHFAMALACEGAGLYPQARDHYHTVQALEPELKKELIEARLERIEIKIEDAAETAELDEIRRRLYRRQFEEALAMAEGFRDRYPASRQLGDLQELQAEIRRRKQEHYGRRVIPDYFSLLDKRVGRIARDPDMTLEVAQELLEGEVHEDIVGQLSESYAMRPESLEALWEDRSGGSVRSFSYGTGTFILGKEKALHFGRFDEEEDEGGEEVESVAEEEDDAFDDIVERVKRKRAQRAAERQGSSRVLAQLEDEGVTPEEWWAAAPTEDRIRWLTAYYAEFSGRMNVIEARGRDCRHCDGVGHIEVTDEEGEIVELTCPVCKGLKAERLVRFR